MIRSSGLFLLPLGKGCFFTDELIAGSKQVSDAEGLSKVAIPAQVGKAGSKNECSSPPFRVCKEPQPKAQHNCACKDTRPRKKLKNEPDEWTR